jgi:phosphoglycolate phosphatase
MSHSPRRLVLFDIDGTLLSTDGAARRAFRRAMLDVYGATGPIDGHDFGGKTDPQIARELLRLHGLEDAAIDAGLARLWAGYLDELSRELDRPGQRSRLMPGVAELVDALEERAAAGVVLGLLTGNIRAGAELKLRSVGLHGRFPVGAFGSDSERRDELPAVAVRRARDYSGHSFGGRDVVVIGDTPADVTCGRSLGVTAVAVATGRFPADALRDAGADVVLQDLSDTTGILDILLGRGLP